MSVKVLMHGANGKLGHIVTDLLKQNFFDSELVAGVDAKLDENADFPFYTDLSAVKEKADVIIDFSFHGAVKGLLDYAVKTNTPVILATTGYTEEEKELINKASKKVAVFTSGNMSLGIALLIDLAKKTAAVFPDADIEIVEAHHNRKIDAPSGTALMIANGIKEVRPDANFVLGRSGEGKRQKNDIGIHAIRMGNIVGDHQVMVTTESQQITLRHQAYDRALFAESAIKIASFMKNKGAGLYGMNDYLKF